MRAPAVASSGGPIEARRRLAARRRSRSLWLAEYVENDDRADYLFRPGLRTRARTPPAPILRSTTGSTPSAFAASRITSRKFGVDATPSRKSAPALDIDGKTSLSSSSRFAISSAARKKFDPVTWPPGWARLAARPADTGSPDARNTTGMDGAVRWGWRGRLNSATVSDGYQLSRPPVPRRAQKQCRTCLAPICGRRRDVLSFDVAEIAHALDEGVEKERHVRVKNSDKQHSPVRLGGGRPGRNGGK